MKIETFASLHSIDKSYVYKILSTHKIKKKCKGHIYCKHGFTKLDQVAVKVLEDWLNNQNQKKEEEKMQECEILVRNLKNYKIKAHLSTKELAVKLGYSYVSINSLLNLNYTPSWKMIEDISKLTGKTFSQLFTPEESQYGIIPSSGLQEQLKEKDEEIQKLKKDLSLYDLKQDDYALGISHCENIKVKINRTSQECLLFLDGKESDIEVLRVIPERGSAQIDLPINCVEWVD